MCPQISIDDRIAEIIRQRVGQESGQSLVRLLGKCWKTVNLPSGERTPNPAGREAASADMGSYMKLKDEWAGGNGRTTLKETRQLSGGNQQKVIVAKWLEHDSEIVIFDEPTQGIDVGTKHEIYVIIDQLVESGHSVIVISSDLDELMGIADRMYVMSEGEIAGELKRNEFNKEVILDLASGKR